MTELSLSSFLFAVFVALLVAALVRMSSPVADSADQTPLTTEEELARQARRKAKSDAKRAKALSKKEALAAGGALDCLDPNRARLIANAELLMAVADEAVRSRTSGQGG